MKNVFLVVTILGTLVGRTFYSFAQEQKNVLAINPVGSAFGIQNVEFERVLSPKKAMALYWADSGFASAKISNIEFRLSEQRVTYRYYPQENAPKGGWLGGSLAYSSGYVWLKAWDISMLILSLEGGYRWMVGSFNIAPVIMFRLPLTDNLLGTKGASKDVALPFTDVALGINIGLGW